MGSLVGHVVPGTIFILLSLWWMYSAWFRYFVCRQRRRPYYISTSFPVHCCGQRMAALPIETFFVLFGTSLGIMIELGAGFNRVVDAQTGQVSYFEAANNLQHFAMYFMFFLLGIVQLLIHYHAPIPKHLDMVFGGLAFSGEGLLFYFHGHAQSPIEAQLHVLLVLSIFATVICGIFEIIQRDNQIYATLMRAYFTCIQGSWFYTIGFFLYSPFHAHYEERKDPDAHRTLMLISYYFVLHMAISLFILLVFALPAYYVSKKGRQTIDFADYTHVAIANEEDDEDEIMVNGHTKMEKLNGTSSIH